MRAPTMGLLVSAFVSTLSGAAYALGAGGARGGAGTGGAGGGTAGGDGAGQVGPEWAAEWRRRHRPIPGPFGSGAVGTTSGSSQKQMNTAEMDSHA